MRAIMKDPALIPHGPLPVLSGKAVMRCNGVHDWTLTVNGNDDMWRRFAEGWSVEIQDTDQPRNPVTLLSGYMTGWEYDYDDRSRTRTVTVTGVSDMDLLGRSLTIPTPATPTGQSAAWTGHGPAETVIRRLISEQVGPDAPADYRDPLLVLGEDRGRGDNVSVSSRFKTLLEEVQAQLTAGGLILDIQHDERTRRVAFRVGRDLSRSIRLTRLNGGVGGVTIKHSAPTVTEAIAGGAGEGAARVLYRQAVDPGEWGQRSTVFLDKGSSAGSEELQQAVKTELDEGVATSSAVFEARDIDGKRFGRDFLLGDTITVSTEDGLRVSEPVQIAEVSWDHTGRDVKLQLGQTADESMLNRMTGAQNELIRKMAAQLRELETR